MYILRASVHTGGNELVRWARVKVAMAWNLGHWCECVCAREAQRRVKLENSSQNNKAKMCEKGSSAAARAASSSASERASNNARERMPEYEEM